jgi:endonuclease III
MIISEIKKNIRSHPLKPPKIRGKQIAQKLSEMYPNAVCTLEYTDAYKLLVSGILASQCTDERVNKVTKILFEKFPGIDDLAQASIPQIIESIHSCGFYNVKSAYIKKSMQMLINQFGGRIPSCREDLMSFPGVGRKIANLILGDIFAIPAIVVDTHCSRISRHLGLTDAKDPVVIENDLMRYIPKKYWISFGHWLVAHGRAVCVARKPRCGQCGLLFLCQKGTNKT